MVLGDHGVLRKLRELADAGLKVRNSLPIESGDDDTLRRIIRKPHTLEHVDRVLRELADGYIGHPNLDIDAFFMAGVVAVDPARKTPIRETLSSIERTIALGRRCGELGLRVNLWWMKPNPRGPQYELWRDKYPDKPFHELQFLFPSGIWSTDSSINEFGISIARWKFRATAVGGRFTRLDNRSSRLMDCHSTIQHTSHLVAKCCGGDRHRRLVVYRSDLRSYKL